MRGAASANGKESQISKNAVERTFAVFRGSVRGPTAA
jgi:hypothetical protein